jgi:hypothetical protein
LSCLLHLASLLRLLLLPLGELLIVLARGGLAALLHRLDPPDVHLDVALHRLDPKELVSDLAKRGKDEVYVP